MYGYCLSLDRVSYLRLLEGNLLHEFRIIPNYQFQYSVFTEH